MKITIESTDKIVLVNGVSARVWDGTSESGVELVAFVTRITVRSDADNSQFEAELREHTAPKIFDLRMIL